MTRPAAPRLGPLPAAEWTREDRELLRGNLARADRYLSGDADAPPVRPILGLLARHPRIGGPWLAFSGALLDDGALDPRDRELLILRVGSRTRCRYQWAQLREFLGPMVTDLEGYPFEKQTARFGYSTTINANWKLYMDAFAEFYHAPILHAKQSPEKYSAAARQAGFEAPHYQIDGPHRLVSTSGVRFWEMDTELVKPMEILTRSGLFGPWDAIDLGEMPRGVNPAKCDPWGLDSFQLFPNFVILIWSQGWYLTYHYWPTSYNTHVFEGNVYFLPARNVRERIAQEMAAVTFKEFALQDSNTLEATQMMLETRYVDGFLLNDQEVLCRHLHVAVRDWVSTYEGARA